MTIGTRLKDLRISLRPRLKEWQFMLRRVKQSPLALAGIVILIFFLAVAVLAPVLAPPSTTNPFEVPQDMEIFKVTSEPVPPTLRHVFGTTDEQYDLYYACIWGTITAFRVGLSVVSVSLIIGLLVGTVAAYYGGILDEILMRFTDIIIAFPGLVLAMALVIAFPGKIPISISILFLVGTILASFFFLAFRPSKRLLLVTQGLLVLSILMILYYPLSIEFSITRLDKVLIAITLVGWPGYTRVIRGEIMRVKNEDYVEAARASGSSDSRIIVKHIWPNTIYPILIIATLDIGSIVLSAAALSFIGLGADANFADWGQIIQRSRNWIGHPELLLRNYHTFLIPGLFISFFVMGWNLLGDALRDVLDPMIRRR